MTELLFCTAFSEAHSWTQFKGFSASGDESHPVIDLIFNSPPRASASKKTPLQPRG
ncbi:MAG: hypothetical protein HGA28_09165 [Anaerolineaceae bacterium]|nr:hypothetical protein [Anaerolineaceae bacterium]